MKSKLADLIETEVDQIAATPGLQEYIVYNQRAKSGRLKISKSTNFKLSKMKRRNPTSISLKHGNDQITSKKNIAGSWVISGNLNYDFTQGDS